MSAFTSRLVPIQLSLLSGEPTNALRFSKTRTVCTARERGLVIGSRANGRSPSKALTWLACPMLLMAPFAPRHPALAASAHITPSISRCQLSEDRLKSAQATFAGPPKQVLIAAKLAIAVSLAGATLLGLAVVLLILIQDRFVYKPSPVSRGTPADFGMPHFEDVSYRALDGVRVRGWLIKQPGSGSESMLDAAPTLIYFHGRDKNASFRLKKAKGFYDAMACNILLVSYRGFGDSQARFPTENGMCLDAESAVDFLFSRRDTNNGDVWVFGESLGGAVAVHIADKFREQIRGLILENTFTSLLDMIDRTTPYFRPLKTLSRNKWPTDVKIPRVQVPILFLSGLRDSFIPPSMMRKLYESAAASDYKELVVFQEGTHNRTWMMKGYFESIARFVSRVGNRSPVETEQAKAL